MVKYSNGLRRKLHSRINQEYTELINGLLRHGKELLVKKIFITMNEHFIKLRDSDREEEREFYPGKTAEEMFLDTESESKSQG